jgi:serine/threonine protein kinase
MHILFAVLLNLWYTKCNKAPEILDARIKYDKSVDYWSLGVMIYDMITGAPPFTGSNRKKIMEAVLKKKPFFPKYMTAAARDICTKLLKKTPHVRLGNGSGGILDIQNHAFFKKTNWDRVFKRLEKPPYTPAFVRYSNIRQTLWISRIFIVILRPYPFRKLFYKIRQC